MVHVRVGQKGCLNFRGNCLLGAFLYELFLLLFIYFSYMIYCTHLSNLGYIRIFFVCVEDSIILDVG